MNDIKIEQAFEGLAAEAQPQPGRWPAVEHRIRRSRSRRLAMSAILSASIVLGIVASMTWIDTSREDGFVGPTAGTASAFRDEQNNFQLTIPAGWAVQGYERGVPGIVVTPPEAEGADFSIEVSMQVGIGYDNHNGFGDRPFQPIPRIDGAAAVRWEEILSQETGRKRRVAYRIDWAGRRAPWADERESCASGTECFGDPSTLAFLVTASNDEVWERFGRVAEDLVRSAVTLDDVRPERWLDATVYTAWGHIDAGILYDHTLKTLVQYLDAEASGLDVAPRRYFEGSPPPDPIAGGYRIVERDDSDPGNPRFTVALTRGKTRVFVVTTGGRIRVEGWPPPPTPGGSVADSIPDDALTRVLVRFLEARMEGEGAEAYLCCEAATREENEEKGRLYRYGAFDMIGYRVLERNNSTTETRGGPYFIVAIVYEDGVQQSWGGGLPEEQEFIVVGPGSGSAGDPIKILQLAIEGTS